MAANDMAKEIEEIQKILIDSPEKLANVHSKGKLSARERIDYLLDKDSFVEFNELTNSSSQKEHTGSGVITGYGTIENRKVFIYSQDFSIMAGSVDELHKKKIAALQEHALKTGHIIIGLNESGGARIQEGIKANYGEIFYLNTISSGVIPQVMAIMGPNAGGNVYSPALADFIFMVDKTSYMFLTGPAIIREVTGEDVSFEELGGAKVHSEKSGVASFITKDDKDCLDRIRELISFLPSNNTEMPRVCKPKLPKSKYKKITDILPKKIDESYDMLDIIEYIVDESYFFEVHEYYARNIIVGFSRIGGRVVGIVANQPSVLAGCLDNNSAKKMARFIRFCDCFNIPILSLIDVAGFLPGIDQEHNGIILHGAKVLYAYSEATVPKISINIRKAYGGAHTAMCGKTMGFDQVYAWPSAEIGIMGPEQAVKFLYKKEIANSSCPQELILNKIEEYRRNVMKPINAAKHGLLDKIIDPEKTREYIIGFLSTFKAKNIPRISKKHGNMPL